MLVAANNSLNLSIISAFLSRLLRSPKASTHAPSFNKYGVVIVHKLDVTKVVACTKLFAVFILTVNDVDEISLAGVVSVVACPVAVVSFITTSASNSTEALPKAITVPAGIVIVLSEEAVEPPTDKPVNDITPLVFTEPAPATTPAAIH